MSIRTRLGWTIAIVITALATTAVAFASTPRRGARYEGRGTNFINNGPRWTAGATGPISLRTSAGGTAVIDFRGGYSYYCGDRTATVTAARMTVSKRGSFGTRFTQRVTGPDPETNGTRYTAISGMFTDGGRQATISYLVDFLHTGQTVADPYSTRNPRALGCASWVKGTIRAR